MQPDLFQSVDGMAAVMAALAIPDTQTDVFGTGTATFSACRRYRFTLTRSWGQPTDPFLMVIGLNPSTADAAQDDPTIRRCIGFARDWGFGHLVMTNLFTIRTKDPAIMRAEPQPVGQGNDDVLVGIANRAGLVLAAWGVHGGHQGRAAAVFRRLRKEGRTIKSLGTTMDGFPRHPLYVRKDKQPIPYNLP